MMRRLHLLCSALFVATFLLTTTITSPVAHADQGETPSASTELELSDSLKHTTDPAVNHSLPDDIHFNIPNVRATPHELANSVALSASTPNRTGGIESDPDGVAAVTQINGRVCNSSGRRIILTVTYNEQFITGGLPSGYCTAGSVDAEGIWGKWCNSSTCYYQLWKVGPYSNSTVSAGGNNVRIAGLCFFGCGWLSSIPSGWPRPSGSSLTYTLTR